MPVITLPTGQIMAIPEGIAPAMTIPAQVAQVGQQLPPPIDAAPVQPQQLSPAERAAKIAQWVAFKEQQYRAADPYMAPEHLDQLRQANIKKYESFLGMTPSTKGRTIDESIVNDTLDQAKAQKQAAFDETLRQRQIQKPGGRF